MNYPFIQGKITVKTNKTKLKYGLYIFMFFKNIV